MEFLFGLCLLLPQRVREPPGVQNPAAARTDRKVTACGAREEAGKQRNTQRMGKPGEKSGKGTQEEVVCAREREGRQGAESARTESERGGRRTCRREIRRESRVG